jgi:hypothetical protein
MLIGILTFFSTRIWLYEPKRPYYSAAACGVEEVARATGGHRTVPRNGIAASASPQRSWGPAPAHPRRASPSARPVSGLAAWLASVRAHAAPGTRPIVQGQAAGRTRWASPPRGTRHCGREKHIPRRVGGLCLDSYSRRPCPAWFRSAAGANRFDSPSAELWPGSFLAFVRRIFSPPLPSYFSLFLPTRPLPVHHNHVPAVVVALPPRVSRCRCWVRPRPRPRVAVKLLARAAATTCPRGLQGKRQAGTGAGGKPTTREEAG